MGILLYVVVAASYLGLAAWAFARTQRSARPAFVLAPAVPGTGAVAATSLVGQGERAAWVLGWLLHLALIVHNLLGPDGLRFGFAVGLSATLWLVVAVFWIESFYVALDGLCLLILPLAALFAVLPAWFPGSAGFAGAAQSEGGVHSLAFDAHLVVALAAYGIMTIAALHALLMAGLDRYLHHQETRPLTARHRMEAAVLSSLPPLLTMERLLFRMLWAGFVLLTLTVVTGVFFSEQLFARPMRFDHKTVFTLIAWLIFAGLLFGRLRHGWRGRVALRFTLAGFVALLLAYAGSRFVLEVILHRV